MKRLILLLIILFCPILAHAQLQQSGGAGSAVTITSGGNTAIVDAAGALKENIGEINGVTPLMGNGTTGTGSLRVTIASDNTPFGVNATLQTGSNSIGNVGINAGANLIGTVLPKTTCGTTFVDSGFVSLPTTSTAVPSMTANTCVEKILLSNVTGTAATVTITDNAAAPNTYISSFSIPANSNLIFDLAGMKFSLGVKWSSGTASAIIGQLVGVQ